MPSKEEKISLGAANTKSAQLFHISPSDIGYKSEFNLLEIIEKRCLRHWLNITWYLYLVHLCLALLILLPYILSWTHLWSRFKYLQSPKMNIRVLYYVFSNNIFKWIRDNHLIINYNFLTRISSPNIFLIPFTTYGVQQNNQIE